MIGELVYVPLPDGESEMVAVPGTTVLRQTSAPAPKGVDSGIDDELGF